MLGFKLGSVFKPKQQSKFEAPQEKIQDLEIEEIKARGYKDFEFFLRHFFGHLFWGDLSPVHELFIEREKEPARRGKLELFAAPRGNTKTVIEVIGKTAHGIVYEYQPFTMIIGYSSLEANGKVKDLRDELLNNQELVRVFGQIIRKNAGKTAFTALNGCRVEARGRGGQVRGVRHGRFRPTRIVLDDVEDLEGVQTPEQRAKTLNWFKKDVLPAGQSGDEYKMCITFVGTVLHPESLLATQLKDPSWHSATLFKSVISWASNQPLWDQWKSIYCDLSRGEQRFDDAKAFYKEREAEMLEGTQVLWPDGEPYYKLMEDMISMGIAGFYSEKQNDPFDPESQVLDPDKCAKFKVYMPGCKEWHAGLSDCQFAIVRHDNGRVITSKELHVIMAWDPALGLENKKGKVGGDYAAEIVLAQDLDGYIYCLKAWIKKAKPNKQIETAFGMDLKYGCDSVYLEAVGAFKLLKDPIETEQHKWAKQMRIIAHDMHANKQARIMSMESYFNNGWLLFADDIDPLLLEQLKLFPTVHDDGPDALQNGVSRLKKPQGYIGVVQPGDNIS